MSESRREQILATAAELFAARGFHGVSVAELGAACGISGPALYKHFPSKQAMLAEMLASISERLLAVGRERVAASGGDPAAALRGLVDWHLEFALSRIERRFVVGGLIGAKSGFDAVAGLARRDHAPALPRFFRAPEPVDRREHDRAEDGEWNSDRCVPAHSRSPGG